MSTDAGSAAAPEDTAVEEERGEHPGLESADPNSADSATSTPETADSGVETSARSRAEESAGDDTGTGDDFPSRDADGDPADRDTGGASATATVGTAERSGDGGAGAGAPGENPADEGFVASMLRDATITGLPGETGEPPAEPHSPEAQQQGDEPVGSEPLVGDNPRGAD